MTNRERIQAIYAAFARGDIPAILEVGPDDADWGYEGEASRMKDVLPWLFRGKGRTQAAAYFAGVIAHYDFHGFVPLLVLGEGNDVLTLLEVDFTEKTTGKRLKT